MLKPSQVCWTEELGEVNLISLLEEQIPRYVLRADSITDFKGYDNSDWVQSPCLPPDLDLDLSPLLLRETLKYFTISGQRVSQMTRAYNDVEAVTRLLQEKERDSELAARIGQTLLDRNGELEQINEQQEGQIAKLTEQLKQTRHDLALKDSLLRIYLRDDEADQEELDNLGENANVSVRNCDVENLERQVNCLQNENAILKAESALLEVGTMEVEEKEAELLAETVIELRQKNSQVKSLQEELALKTELLHKQQEEMSSLTTQKLTFQVSNSKLALENAELEKHLAAAVEAQHELTSEVSVWETRYNDLLAMYEELRGEIKNLKRKQKPAFIRHHYTPLSPYLPHGSLALELEDSLKREVDFPRGYSPSERMHHSQRVMETVKSVREKNSSHLSPSLTNEALHSSGMGTSIEGDIESIAGHSPTSPSLGFGEEDDLQTALRRLATRKANDINERLVQEREAFKMSARLRGEMGEEGESPLPPQTPDSCLSYDSSFSSVSRQYMIPEKLQIVKPLEGSQTLHKWQTLATPHMGGIMEPRPGVQIKGDSYYVDSDQEHCDWSDFEEDDGYDTVPGKAVGSVGGIYTYTTSKIIHPTDEYKTTSVYKGNRPAVSVSTSVTMSTSSEPVSQHQVPFREATSTFSMSQAQARSLRERGSSPPQQSVITTTKRCATQSQQPRRFPSIVTETQSDAKHSQTQTVYSQASVFMAPVDAVDQSTALAYHPEQSYLGLVNKIKDMGLNNIMDIASGPGLVPVKLDPIDVGFNTILSIKKDPGNEPAKSNDRLAKRGVVRGVMQRRITPKKTSVLSSNRPTSQNNLPKGPSDLGMLEDVLSCKSSSSVFASHLGYASMPLPASTPVTSACQSTSLSGSCLSPSRPSPSLISLTSNVSCVTLTQSTRPSCLPVTSPDKSPVKVEEIGVTGAAFPTSAPSAADSFIGAGLGWLKKVGTNVYSARSALSASDK